MQMHRMYQRQRMKEEQKEEVRESINSYFGSWSTPVVKHASWTSDQYYNNCKKAYQNMLQNKNDRESLEERRRKLRALLAEEEAVYAAELAEIQRLEKLPHKLRSPPSASSQNTGNGGGLPSCFNSARSAMSSIYRQDPQPSIESKLSQLSLKPTGLGEEKTALTPLDRVSSSRSIWQEQSREKSRRDQSALEESQRIANELDTIRSNEIRKFESSKAEKQRDLESLKRMIQEDEEGLQLNDLKLRKLDRERQEIAFEKETLLNAKKVWVDGNKEVDEALTRGSWERQTRLVLKRKCFERMRLIENDRKGIQYLEAFLESERYVKEAEKSSQRKDKVRKNLRELKECIEAHRKLEEARERESTALFEEEAKRVLQAQELQWRKETRQRSGLLMEIYTDIEQQYAEIELANVKEREDLLLSKNRITLDQEAKEKNLAFLEEEYLEELRRDRNESVKKISEIRYEKEQGFLRNLQRN